MHRAIVLGLIVVACGKGDHADPGAPPSAAPTDRPAAVTDEVLAQATAAMKRQAKLAADITTAGDCAKAIEPFRADWHAFRADERAWKQLVKSLDPGSRQWIAHALVRDPGAQSYARAVMTCKDHAPFMATVDALTAEDKTADAAVR